MVRLSKKHGVNPSLLLCPICREPTGIALTGSAGEKLPGASPDGEAPHHLLDSSPCRDCERKRGEYIALIPCSVAPRKGDTFTKEEISEILSSPRPCDTILWMRRSVWELVFNTPCPAGLFAFVEPLLLEKLRKATSHTPEEN